MGPRFKKRGIWSLRLRVGVALLALIHSTACATRARLNTGATPTEARAYTDCANASSGVPRGNRSLHCACVAGLFQERMPELVTRPVSALSADERTAAAAFGAACARVVQATLAQCGAVLTTVPPSERGAACDNLLAALTEEFRPAELLALARSQPETVLNANERTIASYRRCIPDQQEASDRRWAKGLAITWTILAAASLAVQLASLTRPY